MASSRFFHQRRTRKEEGEKKGDRNKIETMIK